MDKKTDKAREKLAAGDLKGALSVVHTFRLNLTAAERADLKRAHEVLSGNDNFYIQLKMDPKALVQKGEAVLRKLLRA